MTEDRFDLDDATDGVFYFGSAGQTTIITGSCTPELILETYEGIRSKRLYRFSNDENNEECFRFAYKDYEGIECPECGEEQFIDDIFQEQDHDDECKYRFDSEKLSEDIKEKNKECNKWFWSYSAYHKLEAALLELFENLNIIKKPSFKTLKKEINKTEERICKEIDPDYLTENDLKKLSKQRKKEEKYGVI